MAVKYFNDGTDYRLPAKGRTALWIRACVQHEKQNLGPVNFIFCSPQRHLEINSQFLGHDYRTDVITFDYSDLAVDKRISGDIFIDPETVSDNASRFGTTPENEMRRVLVHGVLHLCGYGDKTPEEEAVMRLKEDFYIDLFEKE